MPANRLRRSRCPINLSLEIFGDRWTLLILRDMAFRGRRHFRELLKSPEGISTNILADRLTRLQEAGLITRADDPSHKQKGIFSLTKKAVELVPVLVEIAAWGQKHLPAKTEARARTNVLKEGGPALEQMFMDELRDLHLGSKRPPKVGAR